MGSGGSNCPYYQSYKYCLKADRDINDDLFDYYCMLGYSYTDCPIYRSERSSNSSGGCFITSACTESKNLPDNCYELTILRWFRDNVLTKMPNGKDKIEEYYHIAPEIVSKINSLSEKAEIYDNIYTEWISPCVNMIDNCKYDEACKKYTEMVLFLKKKYLKGV